jgi:hypothetical protein
MAAVHVFGVRHHGPGSARAVAAALAAVRPDRVLVEGPPDADDVLPLAGHAEMVPPVAILVYVAAEPKRGVYYPLVRFSPEWVAIRWALQHQVPVRFMDLPQSARLGEEDQTGPGDHHDPLGDLAAAAGYDDGERWWEHLIEHRRDQPVAVFDAICDAMHTLREDSAKVHDDPRREAWMRKTIREELKAGGERIAVVCGAWHAPALTSESLAATKKDDDGILKGLPKTKTVATWVPWTYTRMTFASGYGAGVQSPGWYDHLWDADRDVLERWLTRVARLLREKDLDCSSAHVIEATRLARGLACMRGRVVADLSDIADATRSVFCFDSDLPMRLIGTDLLVGATIGDVPADAPMVPLQQDLLKEQKRLRLKPEALEKVLDLDLRMPTDLGRSHLLHRLRLLGIPWGEVRAATGKGTFKETWALRWQPEYLLTLIEKAAAGNTVAVAAATIVGEAAESSDDLRALAGLVGEVVLADLPGAVDAVLSRVGTVAAVAADVGALMDAAGPLAAVRRYGSVRKTDSELVTRTLDGLLPRIAIGLPPAVASLDDDAAAEMDRRIIATDDAVQLVESAELTAAWRTCLARIVASDGVHGLVRGGAARRLFDAGVLSADEVGTRMSLALSPGADLAQAAAWLEGFFRGSGLLLLHDARLLGLIDDWVAGVPSDKFDDFVALVRRTFSTFPRPERRQLGQQLARGGGSKPKADIDDRIDVTRARLAVPLLKRLLGNR